MADTLEPEQAVRVLRAVGGKLEHQSEIRGLDVTFSLLAADVALIAQLVADHIERSLPSPEVGKAMQATATWGPAPEDWNEGDSDG